MKTQQEIVTYAAPRWAWDTIFETLELDSQSAAFEPALREQIKRALCSTCEIPS